MNSYRNALKGTAFAITVTVGCLVILMIYTGFTLTVAVASIFMFSLDSFCSLFHVQKCTEKGYLFTLSVTYGISHAAGELRAII